MNREVLLLILNRKHSTNKYMIAIKWGCEWDLSHHLLYKIDQSSERETEREIEFIILIQMVVWMLPDGLYSSFPSIGIFLVLQVFPQLSNVLNCPQCCPKTKVNKKKSNFISSRSFVKDKNIGLLVQLPWELCKMNLSNTYVYDILLCASVPDF